MIENGGRYKTNRGMARNSQRSSNSYNSRQLLLILSTMHIPYLTLL